MAQATISTVSQAKAAGFTVPYFASSDFNEVDILVREGTDLDDRYQAYVPDWNEVVRFNGWMWSTEALPAETLCGEA